MLTLTAAGSGIVDSANNALSGNASDAWTVDTTAPTATITAVTPDPRNNAVATITITFSEAVSGFEIADLSFTRNGTNLLPSSATLTSGDNVTWTLGNLTGLTGSAGSYVLTLTAAGSGIVDSANNALSGNASDAWTVDTTAPTATITAVTPDPRNNAVATITITFSEAVSGFEIADLSFTRNGTNLLPSSATLTSGDNVTWTLGNLTGLTGSAGSYALTLTAAGSGIVDAANNALSANASDSWDGGHDRADGDDYGSDA